MVCAYCGTAVVVPAEWRPSAPPAAHYADHFPPPPLGRSVSPLLVLLPIAVVLAVVVLVIVIQVRQTPPLPTPSPVPEMPEIPKPVEPKPEPPGFAKAVLKFGGEGVGPGLFKDARCVAVDGAGNIYVGEYYHRRVQVFDSAGKFVTQWNVGPQMAILTMAADRKGNVYIQGGGTIWRFEGATGKELGHLDYPGPPQFDDVAVTPDGGLLASQTGLGDNIVRFNAAGRTTLVIREAVSSQSDTGELELKVAVDGIGHIYALSSFSNAVYKFSMDGKYISKFGSQGDQPGQFTAPLAIAVDGQGRVYVADFRGIQVFDGDGRYLDRINGSGFGMVFNDKDELLVAARTEVIKYAINKP